VLVAQGLPALIISRINIEARVGPPEGGCAAV
jgi:hypothetical protein